MQTIIVLAGVAIAAANDTPTDTERGLLFDSLTYSGLTLANVQVYQADPPADFVGGKYLFDGATFSVNPAWVEPAQPAPATLPTLTITSITGTGATIAQDFSEVRCPAGTALTIDATLSAPLTGTFAMPIIASDGRERFISVGMVGGAANFTVTLNESGLWEVTEARINRDLPEAERMTFVGIKVIVTL